MAKSHAAGWASDAPTPDQLKEFFAQVASGKITKERLQAILRGGDVARKARGRIKPWLSLVSRGLTGEAWISQLESKGFRVGDWAKQLLRSKAFIPTSGVTYDLVVMKGDEFTDENRTNENIREEAARRGYLTPPAEVAAMLREALSDKEIEEMGLWALIVMHEPITDADGFPSVLGVNRDDDGRWLDAWFGHPQDGWDREFSFVFLAPRASA